MTDLQLMPTANLVAELASRHDHFVMVGRKDGVAGPADCIVDRRVKGDPHVVIGLLMEIAVATILGHLSGVQRAPPEFDDQGGGNYGQEDKP